MLAPGPKDLRRFASCPLPCPPQTMAVDHYENFPVASILMPAALRPAVRAIYAFARSADDLADEGDALPEARLAALRAYEADLDRIDAGEAPVHPILQALQPTVHQHGLSTRPFRDLLSAFQQDVTVHTYADPAAVADYCQRSANPVGHLMLALWQQDNPQYRRWSDAICTALQRINFLQDVAVDAIKPRIYLAQSQLQAYGLSSAQVLALRPGQAAAPPPALCALICAECADARRQMLQGAPLARALPGRIGLELRLVVAGGLRILDRIEAVGGDVVRHRPQLGAADWLHVLWTGWVRGFPPPPSA